MRNKSLQQLAKIAAGGNPLVPGTLAKAPALTPKAPTAPKPPAATPKMPAATPKMPAKAASGLVSPFWSQVWGGLSGQRFKGYDAQGKPVRTPGYLTRADVPQKTRTDVQNRRQQERKVMDGIEGCR